MQQPPRAAAVEAAVWSWKAVRTFVERHFDKHLSRRSCVRYLHRLDFVWKRPKRRYLKANDADRQAFVETYKALLGEAQRRGARIFFVDEAHFRADGDLRGMWVLRGEEALVDSTSPGWGEKTSWYSAICLETGEVVGAELHGNSSAATSALFLKRLRAKYAGPLIVIWDNSPAHHGEAIRDFLQTPDLDLQLVRLPAYSPDYNADEMVWKWIRDEVTANTCLGSKAVVQAAITAWFEAVDARADEVKHRCRTALQTAAFPETSNHPQRRERKRQQRRQRAVQPVGAM